MAICHAWRIAAPQRGTFRDPCTLEPSLLGITEQRPKWMNDTGRLMRQCLGLLFIKVRWSAWLDPIVIIEGLSAGSLFQSRAGTL